MSFQVVFVDAFTDAPFSGNPAVVCLTQVPVGVETMQAVARELNQPATAFVAPDGHDFRLRWFSPKAELGLCGHGTLASAHAVWEAGMAAGDDLVRFRTQGGVLSCSLRGGWVAMDFPAEPARAVTAPPADLSTSLGVQPRFIGRNRFDYLVELDSAAAVRNAAPDLAALATVPTRGVILTAPSDAAGYDFVSRFFAPAVGAGEDAVTGSAHCCLGPFWGERMDKDELVGFQASARGGTVRMRLRGERIDLLGQAVTVVRGQWSGTGSPLGVD